MFRIYVSESLLARQPTAKWDQARQVVENWQNKKSEELPRKRKLRKEGKVGGTLTEILKLA